MNFVHIRDTANAGDAASCPALYFDFGPSKIFDYRNPLPDGPLVIGGGTMVNWLQSARLPRGPKVGWGIGSSIRGARHVYPTPALDLVGVRDYDVVHPERWVPCVSCMSPLFDGRPNTGDAAVRFLNADPHIRAINPVAADDLPTMFNTATMADIVTFLASADTVVTDSYHGAYWATLLGCRVVVVPYSSKFWHMKYAPAISYERGADWRELERFPYPWALEQCREVTVSFYRKVCELLDVEAAA